MVATLCSHSLPLRSLLPKYFIYQKIIFKILLYFHYKTNLSFIKAFQIFIKVECGWCFTSYHPFSTLKKCFYKIISLYSTFF
jgi:hypothetical protein